MRIIYNPNPAEEIVRICQECKCRFAYTEGDVRTYSYNNEVLGPGSYGYRKRYILCPNCGKEIIIEEKSSPDYFRQELEISPEFEQLIREGMVTDQESDIGPDIEDFTMYPHLENPDEDD